ncbi:MAG: hypothetical protein O4749_03920 [Trichodesmium sp. St5_bin2_1]|nr:hypothetical protein [Trichodesmium sp. St5_bin2_1]MDE5080155.1 hypothetical protein [Trichodesmium sp. St18_bin1]
MPKGIRIFLIWVIKSRNRAQQGIRIFLIWVIKNRNRVQSRGKEVLEPPYYQII